MTTTHRPTQHRASQRRTPQVDPSPADTPPHGTHQTEPRQAASEQPPPPARVDHSPANSPPPAPASPTTHACQPLTGQHTHPTSRQQTACRPPTGRQTNRSARQAKAANPHRTITSSRVSTHQRTTHHGPNARRTSRSPTPSNHPACRPSTGQLTSHPPNKPATTRACRPPTGQLTRPPNRNEPGAIRACRPFTGQPHPTTTPSQPPPCVSTAHRTTRRTRGRGSRYGPSTPGVQLSGRPLRVSTGCQARKPAGASASHGQLPCGVGTTICSAAKSPLA